MQDSPLTNGAPPLERARGGAPAAPRPRPAAHVARSIPTAIAVTGKPATAAQRKAFLATLFPSRTVIITSSVAAIVSGAATTALLAFINNALQERPDGASFATRFLGLVVLALGTGFVSQFMVTRLLEHSNAELRVAMNRRVLALPFSKIETLGPSRLIATLTGDIFTISTALGPTLTLVWANVAIVLVCIAYLVWLSWTLALWIIPFAIVITLLYVSTRLGDRYHKNARELGDALIGHYRTIIEGSKELKMHRDRREALMSNSFRGVCEGLRDNFLKGQMFYLVALNVLGLLSLVAIAGLLLFGFGSGYGPKVIGGYVLTILYVQSPIRTLGNTLLPLRSAAIAMGKIASMGLTEAGEQLNNGLAEPQLETTCNALSLEQVAYSYAGEEDSHFTVGPIDLEVRKGEIVFIVGGNGSGKSTLAKVITGLYPPERGRIRLNGVPVDDSNRDWYRQHFSVVFSDFFLFDDLRGASAPGLDDRIRSHLVKLGLDRKVTVKDGILSTLALSRGQQRRLALVAALLDDRPICVFDEWAADQDPEFKQYFYTEFLQELRSAGKAVVAITHDDRYFHIADRVLRMENGRFAAKDSA